MIVFRADSNKRIGEGHMVRCIAIAQQLARLGEETLFITADSHPAALLTKEGFAHKILHTGWQYMDHETETLIKLLEELHPRYMLVDSYYAVPEYFRRLNGLIPIACIDDFGQTVYPVNALINYNAYAESIDYAGLYTGTQTRLLLGPRYAPLRREFSGISPKPITARISDIMITTGSTDPYHVCAHLIRKMAGDSFFDSTRIHMVAGRYNPDKAELRRLAKGPAEIIIHECIGDMWSLMAGCDIAVSAGGTTAYELCACGVPTVLFSFADNQIQIRSFFGKQGAMLDCGDARYSEDQCIDRIILALKALFNIDDRRAMREKLLKITDGRGAKRIAEYLLSGSSHDCRTALI